MKKKVKCCLRLTAMLLAVVVGLTGCASPLEKIGVDQVVLTTGFEKDEVFRIGTAACNIDEFMLYLTNTQNRYENVYGSEIWSVATNNVTLEDKIKDTVGAQLAQIKTMNLLAEENNVSLSEEEKKLVGVAAEEYFSSLNAREIELLHVTKEDIERYYTEYETAHKVYTYIIRDINPEISDDEARTVTVEWIYLKSPVDDYQIRQNATNILAKLRAGEDFDTVANANSDDPVLTHSFGKGVESPEIETIAFGLAEGEISDVIFCIDGYYIIKCISTLDRKETDDNKIKIIEKRKNEAFNEVYGSFAEAQIKQLNEKKWESIELIRDESVKTSDFFVVFEKYLGELKLQ